MSTSTGHSGAAPVGSGASASFAGGLVAASGRSQQRHQAAWHGPHEVYGGPATEPVYALAAGWQGERLVAALTQPGKPDGEVLTGPYPYRRISR